MSQIFRHHKQSPSYSIKTIVFAVSSIFVAIFVYRGSPQLDAPNDVDGPQGSVESQAKEHECSLPTVRYSIYTQHDACYPSSGGIWMVELGPLELQHLGIARFESTERSSIQAEEDAFCHELRKFGGSWYNLESGRDLWVGDGCHELDEFMPAVSIERRVGFPENGGVWVLGIDQKTGQYPSGMGIVQNALTMNERCHPLEKLGAVYCEDTAECGPLDDLSKEPNQLEDSSSVSQQEE